MASKTLIDTAIKLYQSLGGNVSKILGTRTNVNFLGKGKSSELMVDMDINPDALGVLPQSKAVEELESAMGYLTSNKLNDMQANKLISNMQAMKNFYDPPAAPANVTDLATGTRNLDKEGLMSLRAEEKLADDVVKNVSEAEYNLRSNFPKASDKDIKDAVRLGITDLDDLPPPGSRGGPEDISAPFTGAGLEAIKNVKGSNLIVDDLVNKVYLNAGVSDAAQPVVRANAREFLNRVKDLEDPEFPGGPTLSSLMEADDFKFMTEGGGGGMGDPLLLVQKYFGPKVASAVAKLDTPNDIQLFAERLVSVKDVKGRSITDRGFDPESVDISDFEFADGGLARPGYVRGKLVGKALGLFKRQQALEKGTGQGFAAVEQYGITGKDITRMFKELAVDPSLQGKEKTEYFKVLNQALKNPEEFPDTIKEIQMKLGIEIGTGFRNGGLAGILEV